MSTLSKRYAEALLSLAIRQDKTEQIKKDLDLAKEVFSDMTVSLDIGIAEEKKGIREKVVQDVKGLASFFKNVRLDRDTKIALVKSCLGDKIDQTALQFIYVLIEKNRISHYEEIFDEYHRMANRELGIKEGVIESVRPLDEEKVHELEKVLSTEKERVVLIPKLNDELISGFKITFENEVVDRSMSEKIRRMTKMLNGKEEDPWI